MVSAGGLVSPSVEIASRDVGETSAVKRTPRKNVVKVVLSRISLDRREYLGRGLDDNGIRAPAV
jgi:hypothetical protein